MKVLEICKQSYVLVPGTILGIFLLLTGCDSSDKDADITPAETVYFKVGEMSPEHNESYILPLTNPADIAHARSLIQNPDQDGKLILAKVVAATSNDGYKNIDLNSNVVWSWKVSEFIDFTDFTIEILDGGPSDVEDMDFWFPNTNDGSTTEGRIGFWNYTIVAEVDAEELD